MAIIPNSIIPELSVFDFNKSLIFYTEILGFSFAYKREEEGFAFLILDEVQLMIDQIGKGRTWETGKFEYPLGRGINLQIIVKNLNPILERIKQAHINLFLEVEEKWYRQNDYEVGNK